MIDHIDRPKGIDDRRAVLVQAKILKSGLIKLSGPEWIQHELLGWLPAFTFIDSGYAPRKRDFRGRPLIGSPNHSAEYGGIDINASPPTWSHWLTATNTPWFTSNVPLACYLAGMMTGCSGFGRYAVRGGADDWSFTVDELLVVTAARPILRKSGVLRGNNNVVGFIADTSSPPVAGAGGGDGYIETETPEWPEGPISTVHITIGSIDDLSED